MRLPSFPSLALSSSLPAIPRGPPSHPNPLVVAGTRQVEAEVTAEAAAIDAATPEAAADAAVPDVAMADAAAAAGPGGKAVAVAGAGAGPVLSRLVAAHVQQAFLPKFENEVRR